MNIMNSISEMHVDRPVEGQVRRKRGRPPKKSKMPLQTVPCPPSLQGIKDTDTLSATTNVAPLNTKCAKAVNGNSCNTPDVEPSLNHERINSENPICDSSNHDLKPPDSIPVPQKRKRGRPRKTVNTAIGGATADSGTPGVGAPVKESTKSPPHSGVHDATEVHPGGRPRRTRGILHNLTPEGRGPPEVEVSISSGISERPVMRQVALALIGLRSNEAAVTAQDKKQCGPATSVNTNPEKSLNSGIDTRPTLPRDVYSQQAVMSPDVICSHGMRMSARSGEVFSKVKMEEIELELDNDHPMSNSLQSHTDTTVKPEFPVSKFDQTEFEKPSKVDKRRGNFKILKEMQEHQKILQSTHIGKKPRKKKRSWWDDRGDLQSKISRTEYGLENEAINGLKNCYRRTRRRRGNPSNHVECEVCGRTFKFQSLYIIHKRTHTGEKPYKCSDCGKDFAQLSNFNTHKKSSKCSHQCPHCEIKISSAKEFHIHCKIHEAQKSKPRNRKHIQRDVTQEVRDSSNNKAYPCTYCGKVFRFTSALTVHLRVHTGEKPFICQVCGKGFTRGHTLHTHMGKHLAVNPYSCNRCGKQFLKLNVAERHVCCRYNVKHEEPSLSYTCHVCKKTFSKNGQYNDHLQTHSGAKLFCCAFCDQLFGDLSECNAHSQACSEKKTALNLLTSVKDQSAATQSDAPSPFLSQSAPYPTPLSTTSASLQRSEPLGPLKPRGPQISQTRPKKIVSSILPFQTSIIPSHHFSHFVSKLNRLDQRSDPRKYLCPRCGRLFRHMGRLRAHMLTHARDQTYTCGRCGKTLENWRKLWQHQSVHRQKTGRFSCPECGRGFRFVGPYKKHMKEHPEYRWIQQRPNRAFPGLARQPLLLPYQCEECDASFEALDLLFSHQLGHSPSQYSDNGCDTEYRSDTEDHDAQQGITLTLSPHTVSCGTNSHPGPHHPYHYPSLPGSSDQPCFLSNHADPLYALSPQTTAASLLQSPNVPQDLRPFQTDLTPTSSTSGPQAQTMARLHEQESSIFGKPVRKYEKTTKVNNNSCSFIRTRESTGVGVKCVECGEMYSVISDLYDHYLQHARGEL
ncbi:zinc finger protein 420-like [Osmerus eperlanus]|uniref:zinc finger protein 420-like n=1 Tax=Osmerus eperlanus TaxID=29151 RepID=UPI002E15E42F